MRLGRLATGATVLLVGALIALSPFISVWRAGGEMLGELPDLEGVDYRDERVGWSAMFDDEFVLARRTFSGTDDRTVAEALVASGFEPRGIEGFSKECCGDYDAVWADVQGHRADRVVVELTAADADWQVTWPMISLIGSMITAVGLAIFATSRSSPSQLAAAHATD